MDSITHPGLLRHGRDVPINEADSAGLESAPEPSCVARGCGVAKGLPAMPKWHKPGFVFVHVGQSCLWAPMLLSLLRF